MREHILTVVVEDYFHVAALRGAIREKHWDRLEPRLEANLELTLDLLRRHGARATFFVYGRIADLQPHLIERIAADGHEIASRGYWPRRVGELSPAELREDLERAKQALEAAGANTIIGYRSPQWLREQDLWILGVLADEGYVYDSSINPVLRRFAGQPDMQHIHQHHPDGADHALWEFPVATVGAAGLRVAISGGNYIRQFPHALLSRAVEYKSAHDVEPLVFYLMPWELDPEQPEIQGVPRWQRIRHYRNLGKPWWVFTEYLQRYRFVGIADYLGLEHVARPRDRSRPAADDALAVGPGTGEPISVVVPIFNEEQSLTYLRRTLLEFRRRLDGRYRMCFVLVDDCSTDHTPELLRATFGDVADCKLVRHDRNRGVAAAIMTGIREADTEIVCSIDADLSYDPRNLEQMIPELGNADMVTASPYHPTGNVLGVPPWRLFLSKSLSKMYSAALAQRVYTYTSCCRVYRRSAMLPLHIRNTGFLGVAEMLIELELAGGRVVEHPAVLESRLLGESKMKIGRTILAHLGLLGDLVLPTGERSEARRRLTRGHWQVTA